MAVSVVLMLSACSGGDDDEEDATPATTRTTVNLLDLTTPTSAPDAGTASTTTVAPTTVAPSTTAPTTTTSAPTTTTVRQPATVTAARAQNGQTLRLVRGDKLQVVLEECTSCGYQWRLTGIPNQTVFGPMAEQHQGPDATGGQAGGNGRAIFETTATGSGTTGIEIGYFPPGRNVPDERFTLTLVVAR